LLTGKLLDVLEASATREKRGMEIRSHSDGKEAPFTVYYCMVEGIALRAHPEYGYEAFRVAALINLAVGSEDRGSYPEAAQRDRGVFFCFVSALKQAFDIPLASGGITGDRVFTRIHGDPGYQYPVGRSRLCEIKR